MMKGFPPPVLIDTWLHVIYCKEENIAQQKFELRRKIKEHFGSTELAQLYVEQFKDKETEVYYLKSIITIEWSLATVNYEVVSWSLWCLEAD